MKHRKRVYQEDSDSDAEKVEELPPKKQERQSRQQNFAEEVVVIEIIDDENDHNESISQSDVTEASICDEPKVSLKIGGKRIGPEICLPKEKEKQRFVHTLGI